MKKSNQLKKPKTIYFKTRKEVQAIMDTLPPFKAGKHGNGVSKYKIVEFVKGYAIQLGDCGLYYPDTIEDVDELIIKNFNQIEILIQIWPGDKGCKYWGDYDNNSFDDSYYDNHNSSFWVSLDCIVPNDKYSYMKNDCRAIRDIGLYVSVSTDKTISMDLRLHKVESLSLYEAEQRIKTLKRLFVKANEYKFNSISHDTDVHSEMTKVFDALVSLTALIGPFRDRHI
jgi:hypothetical protein